MPEKSRSESSVNAFSGAADLGQYRSMLRMAVEQIAGKYRSKFDESDIVQQTLLEACENYESFRGKSDAEMNRWLRTMLGRNLLDVIRQLRSQKRDIAKEHYLESEASHTSRSAAVILAAEQTSPSMQVVRSEEFQRMAAAIQRLPEGQAEAIRLHHILGWTLAEVAEHMQRSKPAVAGLLHRGLQSLKSQAGVTS